MKDYPNVTIFNHPLIKHKIAILRDKETSMKEFRELIEEITTLMTYESFKDVPTEEKTVTTPLETCVQQVIVDNSVVIVPILRAGLGMVNGVHVLFPQRSRWSYRNVSKRRNARALRILLQAPRGNCG